MPLKTSDINAYVAKAQRALADYVLKATDKETLGEECDHLYFKARYLSGAVDVLTSNHGLTSDEIEEIVHCMIGCGEINNYDDSILTFKPLTIIKRDCCPQKLTDLTDGPGGTLSGRKCRVVGVKCDESGWDFIKVGFQGNNLYVSPDGDDVCAEKGSIICHYKTITAANNAAISGDTIYILPGVYTDTGLGKSGVRYHFYPGASISTTATGHIFFVNSGTVMVTGEGIFNTSNSSAYPFLVNGSGVELYAKFLDATTTGNSLAIYASIAKVHIECRNITSAIDGAAISLQNSNAKIIVKGDIINNSSATNGMGVACICSSNIEITQEISVLGNIISSSTNPGSGVVGLSASDTTSVLNVRIQASNIINSSTGTGLVFQSSDGTVNAKVYSDIKTTTGNGIHDSASVSPIVNLYYKGKITTTTGHCMYCEHANFTYDAEGEFVTSQNNVIYSFLGTMRLRGLIINTWNNASGHGVLKSSSTVIFEDVTVKLANTAAYAIHATVSRFAHVYKGITNAAAHSPNIVYRVNNFQLDPNVI